jgi:hypothetical protein
MLLESRLLITVPSSFLGKTENFMSQIKYHQKLYPFRVNIWIFKSRFIAEVIILGLTTASSSRSDVAKSHNVYRDIFIRVCQI